MIGDGGHAAVIKSFAPDARVVAIGDNKTRKRVAEEEIQEYDKAIHHSAIIDPSVYIGEGTVIMAGVIVQARAQIGRHVILNTNCTVDHDSTIHDFAHISPGANICGSCEIGEGAWVGANATVIQGMKVLPWSVVPAGSTVR